MVEEAQHVAATATAAKATAAKATAAAVFEQYVRVGATAKHKLKEERKNSDDDFEEDGMGLQARPKVKRRLE